MNSEKVKKIKKKLQQINERELSSLGMILQFEIDANDILTYINELESENKRLNKALVDNLEAYKDGFNEGAGLKKGVDDKLKTENQQLKDRITELESENELLCNAKVVYENVDYCYEDLKKAEKRIAELEEGIAQSMLGCEFLPECTNDKLKEFAERLKEKAIRRQEFVGELAIDDIEYVKTQDIDELLKEYEK